ncbi:MAG: FAD-dependent oxidoreductase [Candidatus Bilamarchaeaceae archaeon]
MMPKKCCAVIGAGPAGMFAAYELAKAGMTVMLIESGLDVEARKRAIAREDSAGPNYISGMGGSGTFSDGKLNLHPEIGGNLLEFVSRQEGEELVDYVDRIFVEHGAPKDAEIHPKARELEIRAMRAGLKFVPIRQKHIGSDVLPIVITSLKKRLESLGVKLLIESQATDVVVKNGKVIAIKISKKGRTKSVPTDYAIVAPGRAGSQWLLELARKKGIDFHYGPLDIGVRVEVPNEVMEEVTKIAWDPKFHIRTEKYDDFVRTFCTNYAGFVITENYGKFVSVNGHSMKGRRSSNTNFAFLVKIALTQPLENTTQYGRSICMLTTTIGGGKPILQRLGDLKSGHRSTWERIERSGIEPTNRDVTPGDIAMALPARIVEDIVSGLDVLARVIPGVNDSSTLLYAPEVKFKSIRLKITKKLETEQVKNLFTAGDGAGVSGGIVAAAATGLIAAREILRREGLSGERR